MAVDSPTLAGRQAAGRRSPEERKAQARSRVTNGSDVLPRAYGKRVDGRTAIARRFYDVCQVLIADQAGIDQCSEVRLQLIRRFAAASVIAEQMEAEMASGDTVDVEKHVRLCSALCKIASRIGLARRTKDITPHLHDYLEMGAAQAHPYAGAEQDYTKENVAHDYMDADVVPVYEDDE